MSGDRQSGFAGSLSELLRQSFIHQLTEVHVCMPGKIESYNPNDGTATIKPTLSRRFRGADEPVEYPVIPKVPLVQPRTAKARINFPVEKGDLVLLVFADRNLENWIQSSGTESRETGDVRSHDLSDAFAILGGYPTLNSAPPKNPGALNIEVEAGTKVAITNGSIELLDLLDRMLIQIQAIQVSGSPISNITEFVEIQTLLGELKV